MRRSTKGDQHQVGDGGSTSKRGAREVKGRSAEKGLKEVGGSGGKGGGAEKLLKIGGGSG